MLTKNVRGGLLTVALLLAAVCAEMSRATAHSWYPKDCCSDQDCISADEVSVDANGSVTVFVGSLRIVVPRDLRVRSSPDGRSHVCFRTVTSEEGSFISPICFFRPPQS